MQRNMSTDPIKVPPQGSLRPQSRISNVQMFKCSIIQVENRLARVLTNLTQTCVRFSPSLFGNLFSIGGAVQPPHADPCTRRECHGLCGGRGVGEGEVVGIHGEEVRGRKKEEEFGEKRRSA